MPVVMPKGKKCAFIYDLHVDGPCLWFGGGFSTNPLPTSVSRGEFALREGLPRMLGLLRKLDLKCTFAVPGHDAESFPEQCRTIVEDGHEVIYDDYIYGVQAGLRDPGQVFETYRAYFDYMYDNVPGGVMRLVHHPQVVGHAHIIPHIEAFLKHIKALKDVWIARCIDVAQAFSD